MTVGRREVGESVAVDGTVQYLGEAPHWQDDGETVDVVDDTETGEESVENVPEVGPRTEVPDVDGQSTWDDWGGDGT